MTNVVYNDAVEWLNTQLEDSEYGDGDTIEWIIEQLAQYQDLRNS